jgi:hypothetical protein
MFQNIRTTFTVIVGNCEVYNLCLKHGRGKFEWERVQNSRPF